MTDTYSRKKTFLVDSTIGIIGFMLLILANPLLLQAQAEPVADASNGAETVESFFLEWPEDAVCITHNGKVFLAPYPTTIPLFTEPNIKNSLAVVAKIRDAEGTIIGFASEMEVFLNSDFEGGDIRFKTDWTIVIPGRGTLFLHQEDHDRELVSKIVKPTMDSGKDWEGDLTLSTTAGPRADGRGIIVGGTGEFEGAKGSFLEIGTISKYTADGNIYLRDELRVFREDSK